MTALAVGTWCRRRGQKWHEVESVIDGDAVTQCGRRMDRVNRSGELQVSEVMPLTRMIGQPQNCRYCDQFESDRSTMVEEIARHSTTPSEEFVTLASTLSEDDGSTHPDDTP